MKRLLDLFCGAGGAAMGYHQAGFDVVGVDIKPMPRFPFEFVQDDALDYLVQHGEEFDIIHASPPCQAFSQAVKKKYRTNYLNLIPVIREQIPAGSLYVIENVPTARQHLVNPITLCGSSFGLPIRRHRLFEVNFCLTPVSCRHQDFPPKYPPAWNRRNLLRVISISGGYQTGNIPLEEKREAMGVDWDMNIKELSEAIPPAYTKYIGETLIRQPLRPVTKY